jgi:hypothetical protein
MIGTKDDVVTIAPILAGRETSRWPLWLYCVVIVGALLMVMGGVIALVNPAMLASGGGEIDGAVRIYAGYLVSRNLALAAMLLIMLGIRARNVLSSLMVLTAFIQLLDATMDLLEGRWVLVPGVLIFAIAFFLGAARLSGQAFWRPAAWRDAT